jgi:hypothetical protein
MEHRKIVAPTQDARLEELLVLFDCGDEIAPLDADALATKAGELIAKVVSHLSKASEAS